MCSHMPATLVLTGMQAALSKAATSVGIPHVVGGAMVVDAVMSMVGVGLGDAVVEAVLPGWEAINAGGHAMEAQTRIGGAMVGAALR